MTAKLTKQHSKNIPLSHKDVSKNKFRCRHCNKCYEDWVGCYECPCLGKVKWNGNIKARNRSPQHHWQKFIGMDKTRNDSETERHRKIINKSKAYKILEPSKKP